MLRRLLLAVFLLTSALAATTVLPEVVHAETLCEDGWVSPSDGGPGTCSWHGGVQDGPAEYRDTQEESAAERFFMLIGVLLALPILVLATAALMGALSLPIAIAQGSGAAIKRARDTMALRGVAGEDHLLLAELKKERVSAEDISHYKRAGVSTASDMVKLRAAGILGGDASDYRAAGVVDVDGMISMKRSGVRGYEAREWVEAGLTTTEEIQQAASKGISPYDASAYHRAGIPRLDWDSLHDAGLDGSRVKRYVDSGCRTAAEMIALNKRGYTTSVNAARNLQKDRDGELSGLTVFLLFLLFVVPIAAVLLIGLAQTLMTAN